MYKKFKFITLSIFFIVSSLAMLAPLNANAQTNDETITIPVRIEISFKMYG